MSANLTITAADDIDADGPGSATTGSGGGGGGGSIGNGWTEIISTKAGSSNQNDVTTPGVNTTGADLIIAIVGFYNAITAGADMSDSKGNTWSITTAAAGGANAGAVMYYSRPSSVGSGHTFTFSHSGSFPSVIIYAVSGSNSSVFDNGDQNVGGASSVTSLGSSGGITPGTNTELIISGLCDGANPGATPSIDSGMTLIDYQPRSANANGISAARVTQGTAASINPVWSWVNSIDAAAKVAGFKHS